MHYRFDSYHSSQFIFTLQHRTPPHRLCDFLFSPPLVVHQCFRLQLPRRSHQTAEAGGRARPSAKGEAEDE